MAMLFITIFLSILVHGCNRAEAETDQLSGKITALEMKVDSLQKQVDDQALKSKIAGSLLFKSPLENFFQSPEFWENTYDSGQADCSNRCIKQAQTARKTCQEKTDENERLQCYKEASDRTANCQKKCANL